jgi:hypothetical protein
MAAAPAPPIYVNAEIEDFWKILWHIDVKKDQTADYRADIVDSFLPLTQAPGQAGPQPGIIVTDFFTAYGFPRGSKVSQQFMPSLHDKDTLMNQILQPAKGGDFFPNVFNDPDYANFQAPQRVTCRLTGKVYEVATFVVANQQAELANIHAFLQIPADKLMFTYIDTPNHTEEIINPHPRMMNLYTRASQNDAADKPTIPKFGNKIAFERPIPTGLVYPNYDVAAPAGNHGLSHFFCKHLVTLYQQPSTAQQRTDGRLNVKMIYSKEEGGRYKTIEVEEGDNTAGGASKQKKMQKKGFKYKPAASAIEITSLSKHHGDIGQVLDKNRIIEIESYANPPLAGLPPTNVNTLFCFVSIDQNAISKYLSCAGEYTIYYNNIIGKMCIIKPISNPEADLEYSYKDILNYCNQVQAAVDENNVQIAHILQNFNEFTWCCHNELIAISAMPRGTDAQKTDMYKAILKKGLQIIALLPFIPKEAPVQILPGPGVATAASIAEINAARAAVPPNPTAADVQAAKARFNAQRTILDGIKSRLKIPESFIRLNPIIGGEGGRMLAPIDSEHELVLTLNAQLQITQKDLKKQYDTINLAQDPTRRGLAESLFCRVGSKYATYWGTTLIQNIYNKLIIAEYEYLANDFIYWLKFVVSGDPNKQIIFRTSLQLANVPDTVTVHFSAPAPASIGAIQLLRRKRGIPAAGLPSPIMGGGTRKRITYKKQKGGQGNGNLLLNSPPSNLTAIFNKGSLGTIGSRRRNVRETFNKRTMGANNPSNLNALSKGLASVNRSESEYEEFLFNSIESEITDIEAVLDLYTQLNELDEETVDPDTIVELHRKFFTRIFTDEVSEPALNITNNSSNNVPINANEDPNVYQEGGADVPIDTYINLREPEYFAGGEEFLITMPILLAYKDYIKGLQEQLKRYRSLRPLAHRIPKIEYLQQRIAILNAKLDRLLEEPYNDRTQRIDAQGQLEIIPKPQDELDRIARFRANPLGEAARVNRVMADIEERVIENPFAVIEEAELKAHADEVERVNENYNREEKLELSRIYDLIYDLLSSIQYKRVNTQKYRKAAEILDIAYRFLGVERDEIQTAGLLAILTDSQSKDIGKKRRAIEKFESIFHIPFTYSYPTNRNVLRAITKKIGKKKKVSTGLAGRIRGKKRRYNNRETYRKK